jgi:hypothetical protein
VPLLDDIQYGFSAGEISPTLIGRGDLDKYDLGLALARNYFVDPRGGLSSRPGSIFVDFVKSDNLPTKFFPFKFAPALESTYVMLFGHQYVRFIQDGSYVLEAAKVITGLTLASPAVVTSVAHGYANGDWVKIFDLVGTVALNQQTFIVAGVTANTFQLQDPFGAAYSTVGMPARVSGGNVYRIYTVVSPYDAADLSTLRAHQSRSQITLTHTGYKPRALVRISDTNWTLAEIVFGNNLVVPTGLTITPSAAGTSGVGFTVTAVDADGNESLPASYVFSTVIVNTITVAGSSLKFTWAAVAGASHYRIYRTQIVPTGADISRSQPLGFVGIAFGPEFIDSNIVPNYTETPPVYRNPFADGAIEYIRVTAPGAGYSRTSTVSATVGTGFVGQPVVNNAGALLAIAIIKGGAGYTGASVISVSGGAGATVLVELTPATGNNPAVASKFQQRQVFAATDNDPLTVWGSRAGKFNNFDTSLITIASDAYSFELDSDEVAPIRHLLPARQGLAMFTQALIAQLSSSDGVVRATDALADPQSYVGASLVPPLVIDVDVIYIEGKGQTVRLLTWSDYQKLYAAQDLSILSSHLMSSSRPIESWTFASDPFKLIHAIRSDGAMLTMTLLKEQNVFAWTQNWTKGLYLDALAMQENDTDTVYTMVQRFIGGRWTKMIEKIAMRAFKHVEESWCVDSGLANPINTPNAELIPGASSGNGVVFTASAAVFAAGDVGSTIRIGGGLAQVTAYTDTTHVVCSIIRPITDVLQEDPLARPIGASAGEWSLDKPISSVTGLGHLNGELVSILADGAVLPPQVVVNGGVNLGISATRVIVGLGYTCIAKTLPPISSADVIEDKRKRAVRSAVRLNESRGLKVGSQLDRLREFKERMDERYGEATLAKTGMRVAVIDDAFDLDTEIYYVQDYPLPATILGWINRIEVTETTE